MVITAQDRIDFRDSLTDEEKFEYDAVQSYLDMFKEKLKVNPELPDTEMNIKGSEWDERFLKWMENKCQS